MNMCKYEYPKLSDNDSAKICQKYGPRRDPYCNPKEISMDRRYMYHLFIFYPFSILSRAVMREIKVMHYNKLFMIMIIKRLRKDLSEHGYVLKLSLKQWNKECGYKSVSRVKNL